MTYRARMFLLGAMLVLLTVFAAYAARPTTRAADNSGAGKGTVILNELVSLYEPVPFSHAKHARMSEMSDGCTMCHHHKPNPTSGPTTRHATTSPSQDDAAAMPACKSCHPVADAENSRIPSLKAAYHRQCLDCHREWMDSNACTICHAARNPVTTAAATTRSSPRPDEVVGRMHKPIAAPTTRQYAARYTPADGSNVLFRHDEHTRDFGIRCATCHQHEACSSCHSAGAATNPSTQPSRILQPGRSWLEVHGPCVTCHQADHCNHCHYPDGQPAPAKFDHGSTGQSLDRKHARISCMQCHPDLHTPGKLTCDNGSCHDEPMPFPRHRPGRYRPTTQSAPATRPSVIPSTQPATRPVIIRIRRGGSGS